MVRLLGVLRAAAKFDYTWPAPKTWWAKPITSELFTAGRLTDSQFKSAAEAGFKSIISVHSYSQPEHLGSEVLPSTERMRTLAKRDAGIFYAASLQDQVPWRSLDSMKKISATLEKAPKPALLHCNTSYAATFGAISHLSFKGQAGGSEKVDSAEFYHRLAIVGHKCPSDKCRELVAQVTGEPVMDNPEAADISVRDWNEKYWLSIPVYKNFYAIGQMNKNYFQNLKDFQFKVIGNFRVGNEWNGKPSQEEVTLVNIPDNTGTYAEGGRQTTDRLEATRVFPGADSSYLEDGGAVNYQASNPLEFGDDVGYNEQLMKKEIETEMPGVRYFHSPYEAPAKLSPDFWNWYKDDWLAIKPEENALFACRIGYRAVVAALLTAGHRYNKSSDWALTRAEQLGYHFRARKREDAVKLFQHVLDKK